jgi:hypothetical protein
MIRRTKRLKVNSSRPGCAVGGKSKPSSHSRAASVEDCDALSTPGLCNTRSTREVLFTVWGHASLRNLPESQRSQYKKVLIGPITCCRFPSGVLPVLHRYTDEIGWQLTYILRLDLERRRRAQQGLAIIGSQAKGAVRKPPLALSLPPRNGRRVVPSRLTKEALRREVARGNAARRGRQRCARVS